MDGLDAQSCEYLEWLWHEGAPVGERGWRAMVSVFFLQKERYFRLRGSCSALGNGRSPLCRLLRSLDQLFLHSWQQLLHGILTHVAGVHCHRARWFSEERWKRVTLQRHQITAHSTCILVTLPITKTGKRTGEIQSVIIDDLMLASIITRPLCLLCPSDHLLQRSSHSFRTIC